MGPPAGPDFEDEEPGSYLAELGAGAGTVIWGALNVLLVLGCGLLSRGGINPDSEWRSLLDLVRMLAPVSAVLHLIVTLWQAGLGRAAGRSATKAPASSGKLLAASFALAIASLVLWVFLG
jgi:hypothetical protein